MKNKIVLSIVNAFMDLQYYTPYHSHSNSFLDCIKFLDYLFSESEEVSTTYNLDPIET